MKKIFALILALMIVLALAACGGGTNPSTNTTEATATIESGLTCKEILNNLEKIIEPIADQFRMTQLSKVDLENGETCQPVRITYTPTADSYSIHIYSTKASDVYNIVLSATKGKYTDINFALLSFYLYKSINLPEMDTQSFYDHFKLLTEKPEGILSANGWDLEASCLLDAYLRFRISFSGNQ